MADKIRLLPEVVANQIAAGEVVNRPASVVKEMMENAIDAGARTVKVNFRDGGKDLIQIVDDGSGMSPIDARMAFDRHATSKITSVEDIYALDTFGFRGEALASIAAVAQVELRTRQEGDEVGTQTEINGGQFAGQTPVMCPVGAQFFVRNLFYNVPARRRFLDKSTTSAAQIKAEFQRVALCNPHIAFELYANDAPVYTLCATSLAGRIVDVVGRHIKQNLLEVDADTSIARIGGYIGRPAAAKRRNGEQYLFVNGRYFKSSYLTSAIMKAYEKLIPESSSPSYFLYLTIDPSRIDVNVHPQKTEVKFADEEAVWQIINAAVRETLAKTGAVPLMDFDRDGIVEIPALSKGPSTASPAPCPTATTIRSARSISTLRHLIPMSISRASMSRTTIADRRFPIRPGRASPRAPVWAAASRGTVRPVAACPAGCAAPAADLPFRKPAGGGGFHHPFLGSRRVRGFRFGEQFRGGVRRRVRDECPGVHPFRGYGRAAAAGGRGASGIYRSAAVGRRVPRRAAGREVRRGGRAACPRAHSL